MSLLDRTFVSPLECKASWTAKASASGVWAFSLRSIYCRKHCAWVLIDVPRGQTLTGSETPAVFGICL